MIDCELEITIESVNFKEKGHHFIKIELSQKNEFCPLKHRTEVSSRTHTPRYNNNKFKFPITGNCSPIKVHFTIFRIEKDGGMGEGGDAKARMVEFASNVVENVEEVINVPQKLNLVFFGDLSKNIGTEKVAEISVMCCFVNMKGDIRPKSSGGYAQYLLARSLLDVPRVGNEDVNEPIARGGENIEFNDNKQNYNVKNYDINDSEIQSEKKKPTVPEFKQDAMTEQEHLSYINGRGIVNSGQKILVIVHDLWDLPMMTDASSNLPSLPQPFVTVKTAKDAAEKAIAKAATHVMEPAR
ncbi:hypothetical protein HK098_007422 [Nowakowskiella sp. JEL0407]|nr:hypothetical protein HK098_007422 [Nowakowskiella sp. JEL0407]